MLAKVPLNFFDLYFNSTCQVSENIPNPISGKDYYHFGTEYYQNGFTNLQVPSPHVWHVFNIVGLVAANG